MGAFRLSAYYAADQSRLSRRQFTGKTALDLHDPENGRAIVAIGDIGLMSLAYVRSTGHDVIVSELQRPNLLVVVSGALTTANENTRFESADRPWLLTGRGTRETTVVPTTQDAYEAYVLSMPPQFLGHRLARVEARGGMIWGDAARAADGHLAQLTLALATQLTLSRDLAVDRRLADAWTTVLVEHLNGCLDTCLGVELPRMPDHVHELALRHVRAAEELIYDRPDEIGSIRDIARHVDVSERTLQTAFRKVRGVTPKQVLAQARLHRARRALLDRDGPRTVSEVCRLCGIEHHGRFSKQYKEAFGENPVATLNARRRR
ncbi:putative AraC-family transcriptional regulator [Roseibacterium elongatum DSM 19469]|uniref:Putative AraC-family transcriptional regulator n=1 Tax=Roseicyclus elongatus DSM 19469 TaxID=1294273 RepID=W8RYG5_9RHOB|nr:helix-turn-helix transcriptional regulator [Roseibacterium elongatum]AHM02882.1 putative AraC-family transcriptional regulator [Roseibacterium elongatum DSM 19469]